jgi:hypothetical protein
MPPRYRSWNSIRLSGLLRGEKLVMKQGKMICYLCLISNPIITSLSVLKGFDFVQKHL